jgi:hypothetical protein
MFIYLFVPSFIYLLFRLYIYLFSCLIIHFLIFSLFILLITLYYILSYFAFSLITKLSCQFISIVKLFHINSPEMYDNHFIYTILIYLILSRSHPFSSNLPSYFFLFLLITPLFPLISLPFSPYFRTFSF